MKCDKNKVFNKLTNRCILKHGALAKRLNLSPRRRRKLRGGVLNREGNQGQLLIPAIPCRVAQLNDNFYLDHHVTKFFIQDNIEFYNTETNPLLLQKLRALDLNHERYVYAIEFGCDPIPIAALSDQSRHDLRFEIARGIINTSQLPFFNMRRMGQTFEEVNNLRQPQKDFLRISVQLLHDNGIAHNDLHLKNIMVNRGENVQFGTPKLIDFGLSKLREESDPMQWEEYKRIDLEQLRELFAVKAPKAPKRREREESRRFEEDDDEDEGGPPKVSRRALFEFE